MVDDAIDRLRQRVGETTRIDLANGPSIGWSCAPPVKNPGRWPVDHDVGLRVAVDGAPRRRAAGKRQHIGGGAGGHG